MIKSSFSFLRLHHSRPLLRNNTALPLITKRRTSTSLATPINASTAHSSSTQSSTREKRTALSQKTLATHEYKCVSEPGPLTLSQLDLKRYSQTQLGDPSEQDPIMSPSNSLMVKAIDTSIARTSYSRPEPSTPSKAPAQKLRKPVDQTTIHLETDPEALRATLWQAAEEALTPGPQSGKRMHIGPLVSLNKTLDSLPPLKLPDRYQVVCTASKKRVNETLAKMIKEESRYGRSSVFGLDMEWRPTFVKGKPEYPVGLLQICSRNVVLLIQLSTMKGLPSELVKFLKDKELIKTGVGVCEDAAKLQRDMNVTVNGLVDLAPLNASVRERSPYLRRFTGHSLKTLTGIYMAAKMRKGRVRISNWNARKLTSEQIDYASKDVYASYFIYRRIRSNALIKNAKMNIVHMPLAETSPALP